MTDDEKQEYWEKFFKEMSAECNRGNERGQHGAPDIAKAFASVMVSEHRTLQQVMVGLLVRCLTEYSKMYDEVWHGNTDSRNEAAIAFVRNLANESIYFPFI